MLSSHKGHVSYAEYQEPVGFIWKQAVTFCFAFVEAVGEFGLELEVVRSLFFCIRLGIRMFATQKQFWLSGVFQGCAETANCHCPRMQTLDNAGQSLTQEQYRELCEGSR